MPRRFWEYVSRSTLKREMAFFLLGWWLSIGTYLLMRMPVSQYQPDASLVAWGGLAIPVLGVVTAAFGADWVSKQTTIAGPPQNTETTVKTEVTDTTATVTTSSEPKP
jgi:hypothetical protein